MSTNKTEPFNYARICTRMAHCPVCEQPNRCRLETDEPCNGPCWCDLPTLSESGVPGFDVTGWYVLLAPAGTPQQIVARGSNWRFLNELKKELKA